MSITKPAFPVTVFVLALFILGFAGAGTAAEIDLNGTGSPSGSEQLAAYYTVCDGDTLSEIAGEYRISVRELMRANGLSSSLIKPGQVLTIPPGHPADGNRGVSREELMLLARLIHAEARGECFEGKVAVGAVIINRLESPLFPKTIPEVIYQKTSRVYQFSPVADGTINLEPDKTAIQAAKEALAGRDPTGGALFFYNPDISKDKWIRTIPVMTRIGNHVFATCS